MSINPATRSVKPHARVAVVDDHAFMRDLIARELTRADHSYDVVAAVGTAGEAVAVCRKFAPHLVVLDIHLPDRTGIAAVPEIRRASPQTRILLCTAYPKEDWLGKASDCGADGFVEKTNTWNDFLAAVDSVSRGQRYFCSAGAVALSPGREAPDVQLSPRQREILELIAIGLTTKEIAARLFVSVPTVETHRANLMTKTGSRNVAGLVHFAIRIGLTSQPS